jgi:hypothetical protein
VGGGNGVRKRRLLVASTVVLVILFVAAGYMFYVGTQPRGTYFVVDVLGEKFTMYVLDKETIQQATDQMNGLNNMHPIGDLDLGDGGFNQPWSWHMIPQTVRMTDFSTELCDAEPHMLQDNLTYWVNVVRYYCPWSAKIVSASPTAPQNSISEAQLPMLQALSGIDRDPLNRIRSNGFT